LINYCRSAIKLKKQINTSNSCSQMHYFFVFNKYGISHKSHLVQTSTTLHITCTITEMSTSHFLYVLTLNLFFRVVPDISLLALVLVNRGHCQGLLVSLSKPQDLHRHIYQLASVQTTQPTRPNHRLCPDLSIN
jgi:hypothetical protein